MTTGEKVKEYRMHQHPDAPVKAKDFAEELGISRYFLSKIENDKTVIGIDTIKKLRKVGINV